jgi:1-deoxy-D-xylulose-5-phosphate reductoisomerase
MNSSLQKEKSPKKIAVLGSTGSIGLNTMDVIRQNLDQFEASALSCHTSFAGLQKQIDEFNPDAVALTGPVDSDLSFNGLPLYKGYDGLIRMLDEVPADIVLNGISGSSGLLPSLKTLESGKNLAMANKESIVMAGHLLMSLAETNGGRVLPVDSEHSALFNIMRFVEREEVEEIILTASGGAFRDLPTEKLEYVKPRDALKHPTWKMGPKITIDSATMANKGLEVIEAMHLFGVEAKRIKVLIHPQSLVHSLIKTKDGSLYAQISKADVRAPILNALSYPNILDSEFAALDLVGKSFTFHPWDRKKYPMLALAYEAANSGDSSPIIYNAANERAVEAFANERISYLSIYHVVRDAMDGECPDEAQTIEEIFEIDRKARERADKIIQDFTS